ncbi:15156_t:CDS:2, partial [Acaulospora colombiana]
ILDEYPDELQIFREILQNSDDAKSRQQIFILDRNSYPTQTLFEPDYEGPNRTNLKLNRYQGPALISRSDAIFEARDFKTLFKLVDSEKNDQFDRIGVKGIDFNSVYHITDSPSLIISDCYVIFDPHEWYYDGGIKCNFIEKAVDYPDQFAPFRIPCDRKFEGTLFRYPLRTSEDSIDSIISKKVYRPEDILEMFEKFYQNEGINCLLFLKYVEVIKFYELSEGETEPNLLYEINIENACEIRPRRRLMARNILSMMELLEKNPNKITTLESAFTVTFYQKKGQAVPERNQYLIFNWLGNLNTVYKYFQENFKKDIRECNFVPNVGLAIRLGDQKSNGRLFRFLPLPISTPFQASIHGYFAVNANRTLWSLADNEYLAADSLARLNVSWNKYLFDKVLPEAWARFLVILQDEYSNIQSTELDNFWP